MYNYREHEKDSYMSCDWVECPKTTSLERVGGAGWCAMFGNTVHLCPYHSRVAIEKFLATAVGEMFLSDRVPRFSDGR